MSHLYSTSRKPAFIPLLACLFFIVHSSYSQIPTNQDCLGAIPICNQTYTTPSSTFGTGNYPNEQGPGTCLVPGEYNSMWYTFNISSSGVFAFTINPVAPGADYDWAVYNLTNATCADITTNGSLMVSCNSSQWGVTGISASGVGNWNGPGFTNAFNALLNVNAGETYVLNINNWSGSNGGYTVNFGASTASIFDTVKPKIDTVLPVICTDNQLTFIFSENVLCNTVSDQDFLLTGPGGPYTLSGVTGAACSVGGTEEATYKINVSPPITEGGNYSLTITNLAGSVTDPCNNLADVDSSFDFFVSSVVGQLDSTVTPTCAGFNGEIYVSGTVGTPPYQYSINGGPYVPAGSFTGLDSGTYHIVVKDAIGCDDTLTVVFLPSTGAVHVDKVAVNDITCYNACDGWIAVKGSGGIPPYTYTWTTGALNDTIGSLCPGTYKVTVSDTYNCFDTTSALLTEPPQVHFNVLDLKDAVCYGYKDGSVALNVTGGTPAYTYVWYPYGGGNDTATGLGAGVYSLLVIDIHQCKYDTTITVGGPLPVEIVYPGDTTICFGTPANLFMHAQGGHPPYSVAWESGLSTDNPYNVNPLTDNTYSAVAFDDSGCFSKPVTYKVQVQQKPLIELGEDTVLCYGDVLYKDLFFPGTNYVWQDGSVFYDYSIKEPGVYTVDAYNNCFHAYDTVHVDFDDCGTCVHVPNAFTPNGDGLNDIFLPVIGCEFTDYALKVYNRWGKVVFFTKDPDAGWNGLDESKQSEMGTYVWYLEYKGMEHGKQLAEEVKGNVTLLR